MNIRIHWDKNWKYHGSLRMRTIKGKNKFFVCKIGMKTEKFMTQFSNNFTTHKYHTDISPWFCIAWNTKRFWFWKGLCMKAQKFLCYMNTDVTKLTSIMYDRIIIHFVTADWDDETFHSKIFQISRCTINTFCSFTLQLNLRGSMHN